MQIEDPSGAQEALVKQSAVALIAGLEGFAPPAKFDAAYRDKVVAALKAADYSTALRLISDGLATAQWQVTSC